MTVPARNSSFKIPSRTGSFHTQSPTAVAEIFGGLSGFGNDEVYEPRRNVKRNMSFEMKQAVQSLDYTEADLELLTSDSRQFEVLKQSLRKKGAVTNEVLKQKLPLYLKFKKDRLARTHPEVAEALRKMPTRARSCGRMEMVERMSLSKPVNRVLSDEEKQGAEESQGVLGRIMRPGARRGLPHRSLSSRSGDRPRNLPRRSTSLGQQMLKDVMGVTEGVTETLGLKRMETR